MSQRWFTDQEKQITILLGWQADVGFPGLTGYFMVVWETGDRSAARSLPHAYSNLDQAGQMDYFTDLWNLEKDRLNNFYVKLANDAEGYRAIEFMAILTHHCQACSTDPHAWWTRGGFCDHSEGERAGTQTPAYQQRQDVHVAEQLGKLSEKIKARRDMGRSSMPVELDMLESLLLYINLLEKKQEVIGIGEEA